MPHQNMGKVIGELTNLINYEKDIKTPAAAASATNNAKEKCFEDEAIIQLSKSISKLEVQLMINLITAFVNRDKITENQGDNLKQRLQQIKMAINESSSNSKEIEVMLQQFTNEIL
jgi:small-conductance mechanosensitive channel